MSDLVIVYLARRVVGGKVYVGITSGPLRNRIRKHSNAANLGSSFSFHGALRKYGVQGFEWTTYSQVDTWEEACAIERRLIEEHDSTDPKKGYNLTKGGEGSLGISPSQRAREKISATLKAWHNSDSPAAKALRQKLRDLRKASVCSLETRKKQSLGGRKRVLSEESRRKISLSKQSYPEALRLAAVAYAQEYGFRAAEKAYGIPRPTISRWSRSPEEQEAVKSRMRERHRERQYGYAFPLVRPSEAEPDPNPQMNNPQMKITTPKF